MPTLPEDLTPLAKEFVWLLREDVRNSMKQQGIESNAFRQWWIARGRADYLGWTKLSEEDKTYLSDKTGTFQLGEVTLALPRAMSLVLQYRPDVMQKFTVDGKVDSVSLTAWFFAFGISELFLTDIIDHETLMALDRPAPIETDESDVPAATILMYMTWQLLNPEVKKTMPLDRGPTRAKFMAWFFSVADSSFHLTKLIANRWRQWLHQEVVLSNGVTVPRFVAQALNGSVDLQKAFDLKTNKDAKKLNDWAFNALKPDGAWAWINPGVSQKHRDAPPETRPFGVNLYGFAFGELGTGEDLRMAVEACEKAKIPYRVINIDTGSNLRQADLILKEQVERGIDEAPYAINVFCLPGFDMIERIFLQKGETFFRGHYNIGWWPWEISTWPKKWDKVFTLMDEIWAGSTFAKTMYEKATSIPVTLMPLPVSVERGHTHPRSFFKLPADTFLFLFVFDFNSHLERKNPHAIVEAFLMAFPQKDVDVGLVLKVMNTNDESPEWMAFLKLVKNDLRIKLIQETLDRPDVLGLIECCDAYVSLHRGEGFGRTLAEAMLYGKPVIATNYSGNVDFMEKGLSYPVEYQLTPIPKGAYPFIDASDQAVWAEPDIQSAASLMKEAYQNHKTKDLSAAIRVFAKEKFSSDKIGQRMKMRLDEINLKMLDTYA